MKDIGEWFDKIIFFTIFFLQSIINSSNELMLMLQKTIGQTIQECDEMKMNHTFSTIMIESDSLLSETDEFTNMEYRKINYWANVCWISCNTRMSSESVDTRELDLSCDLIIICHVFRNVNIELTAQMQIVSSKSSVSSEYFGTPLNLFFF